MAPGRCLRKQGCIEHAEITPEVPPYVFQDLSNRQMDVTSEGTLSDRACQPLSRCIGHDIPLHKTQACMDPDSKKLSSKMFIGTEQTLQEL